MTPREALELVWSAMDGYGPEAIEALKVLEKLVEADELPRPITKEEQKATMERVNETLRQGGEIGRYIAGD